MMLHTLNAAPDSAAFTECIRLLAAEDTLLLMGDGVYAALADTSASAALTQSGAALFVLQPHAAAAGILQRLCNGIEAADYDQFVALTEQYTKQQAWY